MHAKKTYRDCGCLRTKVYSHSNYSFSELFVSISSHLSNCMERIKHLTAVLYNKDQGQKKMIHSGMTSGNCHGKTGITDPDVETGCFQMITPFKVRNLAKSDYHRNFLLLLAQLTDVGYIDKSFFDERLDLVNRDKFQHMLVVENLTSGALCATGTVVVEPKFIHQAGLAAHLEDIVVDKSLRRRGMGKMIVRQLLKIAKDHGCYKAILDCAAHNVAFYKSCGFKEKEVQMALYFDNFNSNTSTTSKLDSKTSSFKVRELQADDFHGNFMNLLSQLTEVGSISEKFFKERLELISAGKNSFMIVVEDSTQNGKIVGTATLMIEHKFIHNAGKCGHIEDVVVDSTIRGRGLGKFIILRLIEIARVNGCYKCILDCSRKNVGFYNRCGFDEKEVCMAYYF